jgi:GGDEF domain-containing protein
MNNDLLNTLIVDGYFDIYNRNGFEFIMKSLNEDNKIYLLDFDGVKKLNDSMGYKSVNDIFKQTFSKLKDKYKIGRAFSGDEIFIATSDLNDDISLIQNICKNSGLSFQYIERVYHKNDNLEILLDQMIDNFHKTK